MSERIEIDQGIVEERRAQLIWVRAHCEHLMADAQDAIDRGSDMFVLKVPGYRNGERVRVRKGLTGRFLGHMNGCTAVDVRPTDVIKALTRELAEIDKELAFANVMRQVKSVEFPTSAASR